MVYPILWRLKLAKAKIRVVFDCSAKHLGRSLNDCLLPGPDLTNSLLGVLCRFREENVAFICDITTMVYQFKVSPHQRDYLRYHWWKDGDVTHEPAFYRMTIHIFGATSSPSCSNFGLKQVASDYQSEFGSDVGDFQRQNVYVDDGLKSVETEETAVDLIARTTQLCTKGRLKLHKFVSNSRTVLESVPIHDRSGEVQNVNLKFDDLPVERALGIEWCVESDVFKFRVVLKERPFTRRGLLATVASIYDPLGFIAHITWQTNLATTVHRWSRMGRRYIRRSAYKVGAIFSNCSISISSVVSNLVAFQFIKQNSTTFVTPVYLDTMSVHTYAWLVSKVRYTCRSYFESLGLLLSNLSLFLDLN